MRILALETSSRRGSVALLENDRVVDQTTLPAGQRTAQTLAPAIQQALHESGWQPREINLVAVTEGPGSFTGLRIGVTTAKAFAFAIGAEILGVNTLEVIATQTPAHCAHLAVVLDAYRGQVYSGQYRRTAEGWLDPRSETEMVDVPAWLARLEPGVAVSGPALARLGERLPDEVEVVDAACWEPQAEVLGRIAWRAYQSGRRGDLWSLAPRYYRQSAAEEKWKERGRLPG